MYASHNVSMKYLFLGDSYTCCEQELNDSHRWPIRLILSFLNVNIKKIQINCIKKEDGEHGSQWISDFKLIDRGKIKIIAELKLIAKTSKRTDELYNAILKNQHTLDTYDGIVILIGVNDQFQTGLSGIKNFKIYFKKILNISLNRLRIKDLSRITVLTIPDWSRTPNGQRTSTHDYRKNKYPIIKHSNPEKVSSEIEKYNTEVKFLTNSFSEEKLGEINFVESIVNICSRYGLESNMTQGNGLHYRWDMTKKWNNEILLKTKFLRNF